jgi:hypothetical protein
MDHVCHIIPVLEKNKRYAVLFEFLEKKDTYLKLHKELDDLMDTHKYRKSIGRYKYLEHEVEPYGDQTVLHFHDYLIHADKLVARDHRWRDVLLHEEY